MKDFTNMSRAELEAHCLKLTAEKLDAESRIEAKYAELLAAADAAERAYRVAEASAHAAYKRWDDENKAVQGENAARLQPLKDDWDAERGKVEPLKAAWEKARSATAQLLWPRVSAAEKLLQSRGYKIEEPWRGY